MDTDQIPSWLCPVTLEAPAPLELPNDPRFPMTKEKRELRRLELEGMFYRALPVISSGGSIMEFLRRQKPPAQFDEFHQFVRKDPDRLKQYGEAEEIGAEYLVAEMIPIADGDPAFSSYEEDVNIRRLRIDARKWKVEKWFRKKYGDKTTIDVTSNTTITLQTLVDQRREKMLNMLKQEQLSQNILDGESVHVD
jgi:hypothetical protein